ncbi:hypothetical protein ACFVT8_05350 [Lysinibacillus sp. NPDC058147]
MLLGISVIALPYKGDKMSEKSTDQRKDLKKSLQKLVWLMGTEY